MKIVTTIGQVRDLARNGRRVLVPTMGALHKAHGELIRVARQKAGQDGQVVASIFVNPLQFEPGGDYERYPRPEKEDEEFCRKLSVDLLFRPSVQEMYPGNRSVSIEESSLSRLLEGKSRPGHFGGVCTVVAKLFNVLQPNATVFGEKDFQQLAIIRRMVRDLNYSIDIIAVPTVREQDGLACSSRNAYLSREERAQAPILYRAMIAAKDSDKQSAKELVGLVRQTISEARLAQIDYVEMVDGQTLEPIESVKPGARLVLAVFFGKTRLIDNLQVK